MFISGIGWSDKHRSSMYRQSWSSLGAGRALWSFRLSKLQTSFINARQWIDGSWEGGVYLGIRIWILEAVVWGLLSLTRDWFTEKKKKKGMRDREEEHWKKKKREVANCSSTNTRTSYALITCQSIYAMCFHHPFLLYLSSFNEDHNKKLWKTILQILEHLIWCF